MLFLETSLYKLVDDINCDFFHYNKLLSNRTQNLWKIGHLWNYKKLACFEQFCKIWQENFWIRSSPPPLLPRLLITKAGSAPGLPSKTSSISFSSSVHITITIWTTWNFRDCKYLHVDGWFTLDVGKTSCIPSQVSAYTITNGTYFEWWYK